MKLTELDPTWLMKDGKRIGFTFVCPTKSDYRQSCFQNPPKVSEQIDMFDAVHGEGRMVQPCNPAQHWTIESGIDNAAFETMTVKPSLDGSAGGLWHGFITNGEITGGI